MVIPARILSIGDDENLLLSRELILRKQGYEVTSMASNDFLQKKLSDTFDVAVISQSVTCPRAARVADLLRQQHPQARILRIQPTRACAENYYDLHCEACANPYTFLNAVRTLCEPPGMVPEMKQAAAVLPT